ncbi:hypothetical protein BG842_00505 [Haladaptatus sp. W1]|uniref:hypothetical protein n=1 Tax=Haladaptatus sp. W1 TaxID=1897478 RepID=UPI000849A19C|nr:hypothetical protein [Haladaptatus sp. W1]ODR80919.1 hypothetical protein BG842_00505 [Haladaptatus sp. W1]
MRPETVPLLLVALLLVSAQPGVDTVTTVFDGTQDVPGDTGAVVVADGTVTIPNNTRTTTSLYVIGGTARIEGTLDGRLVQLAGNVTVGSSGTVTDQYQVFGGDREIATDAAVDPDVVAEPVMQERSPIESLTIFLLQAVILGVVSFVVGRRYSEFLANVRHSIRHHPVVSGTVGLLTTVTLLALFVFMAFTIILLPVSLLGLLGGVFVYLYAYISIGSMLGQWMPTDKPGVATAAGTVLFFMASRVLSFLPIVGESLLIAVAVIAIGAVFITYFGLREFQPPQLPPVD